MKLNVMGAEWNLYVSKKPLFLDEVEVLGYCNPTAKEIHVVKNAEFYESLLHELIHAVFFETGLSQVVKEDIEEIICESISRQVGRTFSLRIK